MCHRKSQDFLSYTVRTSFKNIVITRRRREGKEGEREGGRKKKGRKGGRGKGMKGGRNEGRRQAL